MEVYKTLKPGDAGTKRYMREYGDKLVAVRYRKGIDPLNIYTTVEIVVDTKPYVPGITHTPSKKIKPMTKAVLVIPYKQTEVREKVKRAGGRWNQERKVWILDYQTTIDLGLKRWMWKE